MSPRDTNLILAASGTPVTATGNGTAVDTEGGFYAIVRFIGGTISDGNETFDFKIEVSINGGSNYYPIAQVEQIVATQDDIRLARVIYIPQFASGQTATKVRYSVVAAGTTPSLPVDIFVEPLLSLGAPAVDEELSEGLALLY